MMRPCMACGEPTDATRCPDCQTQQQARRRPNRGTARQRGYDHAWDQLSKRARRLQPFCVDCGTTEALTTDHLPSAWQRKADGKPLRLADVAVVCVDCNNARGSSRPGSPRARGHDPARAAADPRGKASSRLHTESLGGDAA